MEFQEWTIKAKHIKSLCWHQDQLIDWVGGGSRYELDGTHHRANVNFSYRFDSAIMSDSGNYAVIYERCGSKGLVLKEGKILGEIDRSFYHADAYEYPVALLQLPNGHEGIAHCPNHYNQLEIDDLATGERLTTLPDRKPVDVFYSRLTTNPAHTMLMSTGWYWHPWSACNVYEIPQKVSESHTLDSFGKTVTPAEVGSAAFIDDKTIIVASTDEGCFADDDPDPLCKSGPNSLAVYDLSADTYRSAVSIGEPIGTIFPIGPNHILSLYTHPKLIEIATGQIIYRWPELNSGVQQSSIIWGRLPPPIAVDRKSNRFAIANDEEIKVIEIKFTNQAGA